MHFTRSVLSVNLTLLSSGLFLGWASPSIPKLMAGELSFSVTESEASWMVALPTLGNVSSALLSSVLLYWIGRKSILLCSAIPEIVAWLLCAFASSTQELYIARFLMGIASGFRFTAVPLYISEIAPMKNRGLAGSVMYLSVKVGMLVAYTVGATLTLRTVSLLSMTVPFLFVLSFSMCPESPHYLLLRGKYDSAKESLIKLRGSRDVDEELKMINDMVNSDLVANTHTCDWITIPSNRKAFFIVFFLVMTEFFTGSQIIFSYAQTIFDSAKMDIQGSYLTILLGIIQVVTVVGMMFLIDRGGRKPLLLFSLSGIAGCSFIIAVYFYLQEHGRDVSDISWLTAVSIFLFTISYAMGISSIPHIMIGEIFSPTVKPKAAAFFVVLGDLCSFFILISFYYISWIGGLNTLFFICTVCDVLGVFHVAFFVPETKRKTLKQVQDMMANTKDHRKKLEDS